MMFLWGVSTAILFLVVVGTLWSVLTAPTILCPRCERSMEDA